MNTLNYNSFQTATNLFRDDVVVAGSNIDINYNYYTYSTSNIYETSNYVSTSNYYSTSNYDYSSNITGYYLNDNPVGSIIDFSGLNAPESFLMCDGASVSRTIYSNLFNIIGVTYGSSDSNSFNVPDLRNKFVLGTSNNNLGSNTGSNNLFNSNNTITDDAFCLSTSAGFALSKSNLPPSMYLNKIIKHSPVQNSFSNVFNNTYDYTTSNIFNSYSNYDFSTSNYYSTSNFSTSNYDYTTSNYYSYFSTSNYSTSNYYSYSNYDYSTSNYNTSNFYSSSNYTESNYFMADTPIGTILDYSSSNTPADFLFCDGAAVSRYTYSELFDTIGTNFGIGDGTTTFNLPNLVSKVTIGATVSGASNSSGLFTSNLSTTSDAFVLTTGTGYAMSKSNLPSVAVRKIIKYTTARNSFSMNNTYYGSNIFYTNSNCANINPLTIQTFSNLTAFSNSNNEIFDSGISINTITTLSNNVATLSSNSSGFTQTSVKSANYTAASGDEVLCDTNAAAADFTITLPASPTAGNQVRIILITQHATRKVNISRNGNAIDGKNTAENETYNILWKNGDNVTFKYVGGTAGWIGMDRNIANRFITTMYLSTDQLNLTTNVGTKINFDMVQLDYSGVMADTVNKRINIPVSGCYGLSYATTTYSMAANAGMGVEIYKNGVQIYQLTGRAVYPTTATTLMVGNGLLSNCLSNDYIEMKIFTATAGDAMDVGGGNATNSTSLGLNLLNRI